MATVYMLLCEDGSSGDYWASLTTAQKARYGSSGSERVYSSLYALHQAEFATTNYLRDVVVEIHGQWTDANSWQGFSFSGAHSVTITTVINGEYGAGYHGGVFGGGYKITSSGVSRFFDINTPNVIIDGLEIESTYSSLANLLRVRNAAVKIRKCLLTGPGSAGIGVALRGGTVENCVARGFATGLLAEGYYSGAMLQNCLVVQCGTGYSGASHEAAFIVNCAGYDNTTNWGTAPSSGAYSHNAGESGDSVWDSDSSSVTISSSDFANYENPFTSSTDLTPAGDSTAHTSSSALVDAGEHLYVSFDTESINGLDRPSYKNGSTTDWDIGPYEFDWGYGLAPQTVDIDISGMAEGSVLAVYKTSDGTAIVSPTTIGATGAYSTTYTYTADTQITVRVRKGSADPQYLPYEAPGLITENGFELIVSQVEDDFVIDA